MKKLEEKRAALNKATSMGDAVLAMCHPDSITTIKHWITIIRARFEEVSVSEVIIRAATALRMRVWKLGQLRYIYDRGNMRPLQRKMLFKIPSSVHYLSLKSTFIFKS